MADGALLAGAFALGVVVTLLLRAGRGGRSFGTVAGFAPVHIFLKDPAMAADTSGRSGRLRELKS